ncbi:hypothetical protein EDC01DRAFT_656938 [Geopyxis carbonaria]|nr:hypothetical protein EDC01DRAFT_656938 [Geopyxis carbonaria]
MDFPSPTPITTTPLSPPCNQPSSTSFIGLPPELKFEILTRIPDFSTLCATITASHAYFTVFARSLVRILDCIFENERDSVIPEALALLASAPLSHPRAPRKICEPFFRRWVIVSRASARDRFTAWLPDPSLDSASLAKTARRLARNHDVVCAFAERFRVQKRNVYSYMWRPHEGIPPPTPAEFNRDAKAFYLFWTFSCVYHSNPEQPHPDHEAVILAVLGAQEEFWEWQLMVVWLEYEIRPLVRDVETEIRRRYVPDERESRVFTMALSNLVISLGLAVLHSYLLDPAPPAPPAVARLADLLSPAPGAPFFGGTFPRIMSGQQRSPYGENV